MDEIFSKLDDDFENIGQFIYSIRKFFFKNPHIFEEFTKFLEEKEELIF